MTPVLVPVMPHMSWVTLMLKKILWIVAHVQPDMKVMGINGDQDETSQQQEDEEMNGTFEAVTG